jgi:hypothetical protein
MSQDYLPNREADLALWTDNFAVLTTATPVAFGLTAPQALDFATANSIWQAALQTANNPSTRTAPSVAAKDVAKVNVKALARATASVVQGFPGITPEQLSDLGLTVRDTGRTPVPPPNTFPLISIIGNMSHMLTVALADQNTPNARRKPMNVIGAEMYGQIGGNPPTGLAGMAYLGLQTRYPQQWDLGVAAVGLRAYVICRWINRRGEPGPISATQSAIVS